MFFEYSQNNSGGVFHTDDKLCARVIIEASSCDEADDKLIALGGYFDGAGDCPCCGNRWDSGDELKFPMGDLNTVEEYVQRVIKDYGGWTTPDARIFYVDGRVLEVNRVQDRG